MAENSTPPGLDEAIANEMVPPSIPQEEQGPPERPVGGLNDPNLVPHGIDTAPPGLDQDIAPELSQETYGGSEHQLKSFVRGAARGVIGPVAPALERMMGGDPATMVGEDAANPWSAGAGEFAGLVGSSLAEVGLGGALSKAGKAGETATIAKELGQISEAAKTGGITAEEALLHVKGLEEGTAIRRAAVRGAIENTIWASQNEVSKLITQDPAQSTETAMLDIGLAPLIGGGIGAGIGAVSPLWKAVKGSSAGQFIEDFKSQIKNRIDNPEPVKALTDELQNHYVAITDTADEVYGAKGIKAQEIRKLMPEMSDKITGQAQDVANTLKNSIKSMEERPNSYPGRLVEKLRGVLNQLSTDVSNAKSPGDIFNAIQEVKQKVQGYSKFDKFVKPIDEAYDFVQQAKKLQNGLRESLEDPAVWGKAAERQKAINSAFHEYLPSLQDFEKKFTTMVGDNRVIDPGKVNTYVNQLGKPNAEIKQKMLQNFLDASDKYKGVIEKTHANLGLDSPMAPSSLNLAKGTLNEVTPGAKLANVLVDKGLHNLGGEALGAATGAALGHFVGAPEIGAIVGAHALGPMYKSVLPALLKPMMEGASSGAGLKSAVDYGLSVAKGESLLNKASDAVFNSAKESIPAHLIPTEAKRDKIKDALDNLQQHPQELIQSTGDVGHYLPAHATALGSVAAKTSQYLNSLKPQEGRASPLDAPQKPSQMAIARYNRALDIAQQPLVVMKSIKDGTITHNDVQDLNAMYPNLYSRLQQKLTNELIKAQSKDIQIPYKTRIGLSLFMSQPMDSTMTPQGIQAIMMTNPNNKGPGAQGPQDAGSQKGSLKAVGKMSDTYRTPSQVSEQRRSRIK